MPQRASKGTRTSPDTPRLSRNYLTIFLIVIALLPVTLWWIERAVDAPANGWFEGTTTFGIGADFVVFHTAGSLVAEGNADTIYDRVRFRSELEARGGTTGPNDLFVNPPAYAMAMAAFAALSWQTAWYLWTAASLLALAVALRLLKVARPWAATAGALLVMPTYMAIVGGQGSLFWLLIIAAIYVAFASKRVVLGGAISGLLILKPTLLIGLVFWWLIDRRYRPALWAATAVMAGIVLVTLPTLGAQWLEYPRAAAEFADGHRLLASQWAQFSTLGFFDSLLPQLRSVAGLLTAITSGIGLAAFVAFFRRHRDDWEMLFAASIVLTLWVAPQVIVYDWVLLIAVGAILVRRFPESALWWLVLGCVLAISSVWSILIGNATRPDFGWALQFAVPTLAVCAFAASRLIERPAATAVKTNV